MCAAASPAQLGSVVMLLAHLANSQEHFKALPPKAFKQLAKVRTGVAQVLIDGRSTALAPFRSWQ